MVVSSLHGGRSDGFTCAFVTVSPPSFSKFVQRDSFGWVVHGERGRVAFEGFCLPPII